MRVRRVRAGPWGRPRPSRRHAQSLVEFAVVLPVLALVAFGGIAMASYIQVQGQLEQAVSTAAMTGARDASDPCLPGDPGYADVQSAFDNAKSSPLFGTVTPTLTIICTSQDGTAHSYDAASIGAWFATPPHSVAGCAQMVQPYDRGCFAIWRGGLMTVTAHATITISWVPFFRVMTVGATAGAQIESYRAHTCSAGVPAAGC